MITYDDIKVGTFINASGTVTTLGGSLMPEPVVEAMVQASRSFVGLDELHEEAGKWLAEKIGVPAAFIPCGAASGMLVAAAACLTGTDTDLIRALPEVPSGKNEFVISYVDEHTYVHQGFRVAGGVLVTAGTSAGVTSEELIGAISERTAAVVHFLGKQSKQQLIEVIAGAHERGVPVIVDAAAQLPPRSNLSEIVGLGADLVIFSGGKGIRGPQATGLVLGRPDLVEAARLNGSPQSAIGRGMKVGKEEIMGLLKAIDLYLAQDEAAELDGWEAQMRTVAAAAHGLEGVTGEVRRADEGASWDIVPHAQISFPGSGLERAVEVAGALRTGEPSIDVRLNEEGILISPMTLQPGEAEVVAERLRNVLQQR
ncbi:MAG: aminotransferase class V-fold PLP-dependent enzyme [Chloroflexota bacterium]|nr:aminotransferase class V-fold PLP-dependent enzyme [Chloroflexota bacterium]MDE2841685.1 aminotransferase class V-fold PLP-dependent enzyme [Chloroflexota bacterium]MDE2930027.1 aminotransferase class V-fold PLP-dependent enzyme [Chloroflexota bacterium]